MPATTPTDLPAHERYARRSLWAVLALFAFVGAIGVSQPAALPWLVPVAIAIVVVALRSYAKSAGVDARTMRHVFDDELRRRSLALACRDAFVAVMGVQPLLAFGVTLWPAASPASFMAGATVVVGLVTLIASLLIRDR